MKKGLILILSALIVASFAACAGEQPASPSPEAAVSSSAVSEDAATQSAAAEENAAEGQTERLVVADASRYEGIVEDFAMSDDGTAVLMMKPEGAEDGAEPVKVKLSEETKFSFDSTGLGNGDHLEVYYAGEPVDGMVTAIAINRIENTLPQEDMAQALIYDGEVVEHTPDAEKPGSGSILMRSFEGDNDYVFNYDKETKIDVDLASLKAGDKLHIVHSQMATRSIPPQSPAFEISAYTAN